MKNTELFAFDCPKINKLIFIFYPHPILTDFEVIEKLRASKL
jgi:hypothetical protein